MFARESIGELDPGVLFGLSNFMLFADSSNL